MSAERARLPSRCAKHEPVDAYTGPDPGRQLRQSLDRAVVCKNCGMKGLYSNGQRKPGQPRRIIWLRREFAAAALEAAGDRS